LPAKLIVGIAGPEDAKNLAGKVLRLIQIRLATASVAEITPAGQDIFAATADLSSRNAVSISAARTTGRFPSSRWASTIQIVRYSQSKADTAAPTPTGFAEIVGMISQYGLK